MKSRYRLSLFLHSANLRHFSLLGFIVMALDRKTNPSMEKIKTHQADMSLQLTSDAFANGQSIPAKYSCIGKNISPALAWTEPPAGTQSFALIVDDPDAPGRTWVHWVLFNIPARCAIAEPSITGKMLLTRSLARIHGATSVQRSLPPSAGYFFKLYASTQPSAFCPGDQGTGAQGNGRPHSRTSRTNGHLQ
jgi:Raf kinase inhibitor-like YbhB/YbcL family protein